MENFSGPTSNATLLKNRKYFSENAIDLDFIRAHEHLESYGPRHKPVSHALILEKFRDKCGANGLMLFNERGALSKDGNRYMYVADIVPECGDEADYHLAVGFRSFNDETSCFQMSCGTTVMMCSNGLQTSVIVPSRRKHTSAICEMLDSKIEAGLECFRRDAQSTEENISLLKSTKYSDEILGKLIIALGRTKMVGSTNIMKILEEVDNPSFNKHDDGSAWRIMNACTTVTTHRMSNPLRAMLSSKVMHDELMKIIKPGYVPLGDISLVEEAA